MFTLAMEFTSNRVLTHEEVDFMVKTVRGWRRCAQTQSAFYHPTTGQPVRS